MTTPARYSEQIEAAFGWQIGWVTSRPRAALSKVFALARMSHRGGGERQKAA